MQEYMWARERRDLSKFILICHIRALTEQCCQLKLFRELSIKCRSIFNFDKAKKEIGKIFEIAKKVGNTVNKQIVI